MSYEGIVKWFASKNQPWGYIKFRDERGDPAEVFAHYRNIHADGQKNPKFKVLEAGQKVSFKIGPGYPSKGTQAMEIRVLDGNSSEGNQGTP